MLGSVNKAAIYNMCAYGIEKRITKMTDGSE